MPSTRTRSLLLGLLLACSMVVHANERVALVIGNAAYKTSPLANPRNDADAMAELLTRAGFTVDKQLDTDLAQMQAAIDRFGVAIRDPKVKFGMFYYAGHGLQQNWRNYIVPVSASIRSAADVPLQTVDVSKLLNYMQQAVGRSFLVILDACRDDPFAGNYRPPAKGLSQFDAPSGSLLAYATAPGNVAQDGDGTHGLYTGYLLREFAVPGARLEDAFKRVRLSVRLASEGAQIPWESTSLEDDIFMFPLAVHALSESERDQLLEKEMSSWLRVKSSNDPKALAEFIRKFPSGSASELAQFRLNRLLATATSEKLIKQQTATRELADKEAAAKAEAMKLAQEREAAAQKQRQAEQEQRLQTEQAAQKQLAEQQRLAAQQEAERQRLQQAQAEQQRMATLQAEQATQKRLAAPTTLDATPYFKGYAQHQRSYTVGDEYHISVIDGFSKASKPLVMKVTQVDTNVDRVLYNDGEFVSDLMGNTTTNQRGSFSTPRQFYPAELVVGHKWQTRFKQTRPNGVTYTYQYNLKVVGKERITVPAGTFEAFKIEARGFNMELGAALERNIWVAPGINIDIAHEIKVRLSNGTWDQNDRQELASFRQAVQTP